jgi:isopropylmalate/homocitrate/citramalate synthase
VVELKESLNSLARMPKTYTGHLKFPAPDKIFLYDDTLRDGEQMPGVAFSPAQKLKLAELLAAMGIDVMDVAFPISSDSDRQALRDILRAQQAGKLPASLDVLAMCRAVPGDIDCVLECVAQAGARPRDVSVLILSTLSDLHLKYKLGRALLRREGRAEADWLDTPLEFYREANIRMITEAVRYARGRGIERVEFAAEDASRSDLGYALQWAKANVEAGGTRFCFSDTCGVFTPEGVDHYFPPIVEALGSQDGGCQLTAHFHNDFGLGALNTVRAVMHGATHPSLTANGIGERAGNTSIHQFVMVLKELYGVTLPRFRYDKLTELRHAVEEASGVPIMQHEPIVGDGVFTHESGMHTAGILVHPAIYQFIREEDVGGTHRFVFGKHSGAGAVEEAFKKHQARLAAQGVEVNDALVTNTLERAKELRARMTENGHAGRTIRQHYDNMAELGISEEGLIELALEMHAEHYSRQR